MGKVIANATMSLDGFIATPDDGIGHLFDWYEAGDIERPGDLPPFHLTHEPSADWSYPESENFDFMTMGIQDAVGLAQRIAGDKMVAIAAGEMAEQALGVGLLDEIAMSSRRRRSSTCATR